MKATKLPTTSTLYKLLEKCQYFHDILLHECHDGALVMECMDCPFTHVLDNEEETSVQNEIAILEGR